MRLIILLILSIVFIVFTTSKLKWHPVLALLGAAFGFGMLSGTMSLGSVVVAVNTGFGNTLGYIGIVILAGTIIGKFLEKSGGAYKLAEGILKIVGKRNVPLSMSITGYFVSIPVFCDSAFIILSPLVKALSRQAKIPLAIGIIALSMGLNVTHSIIPPTPGPVAGAALLNADLGKVIMLGIPVSIVGLIIGWLFAVKVASKFHLVPDSTEEEQPIPEQSNRGPSAVKSIVPILLPIILIILRSISELPSLPFGEGTASTLISFIGQPVVALFIGVLFSFLLPQKLTREMLSPSGWLGQAVVASASIIIITGCGGAFGKVLQDSGIGEVIQNNLSGAKSLGILLPIILAAVLKTAQGSGTVSIITSASLMAPLLPSLGLDEPMARALVVVAIGSGAMIFSHANDSYFWVVTQFSNMDVKTGYRLQSTGTAIMGVAAAVTAWLLSVVIL
ncbi:GntP family permease [Bacteroidota bacterium]